MVNYKGLRKGGLAILDSGAFKDKDIKRAGFAVDPLFQTIDTESIFGSNESSQKLRPFCLKAESPLLDAGLDITEALQIDIGKQDFFGAAIPQASRFDVGACEVSGND